MDKKRKYLKIAILLFMVLSISLTTSQTLAYWFEPTEAIDTTTGTVTTNEWAQAFPFDSNYSYEVGDLVTNNGETYEAKKSGILREPGDGGGWNRDWFQL